MKNILFLLALTVMMSVKLFAQDDKIELDVLRAPSSPASNLLGISTTDIDKPTDISSFMVSIQSSSNSFTSFPSNYAIDLSPYYLFAKKKDITDYTTNGLQKKDFKTIFKQTFVISLAISNPDSTNTFLNYKNTYGGIGFKFSIFRGKYDSETKENLEKINILLYKVNKISIDKMEKFLEANNPDYIELEKRRKKLFKDLDENDPNYAEEVKRISNSPEFKKILNELDLMAQKAKISLNTNSDEDLYGQIKKIASEFQTQRIGFSWDVNGGISGEFRNRNFDNSKLFNAGIWTNLGYTIEKGFAFLGLVRYLYNPDKILALDNNLNEFENVSTFDAGARIAYSKSQSKFSCSIEGIYRSVLSGDQIDPSWKMIFNADYALFKNQKLTFSFGRDFDGTITKDGNLIAALTLIAGFGNKK
ncbi:hypothetical protein Q1W71_21435 [Flavobacterium pectinovorum]|uniref:hypothetical protein n=1 Tax=Flavobacterium pectinovorum TaxID=29533 RepID=UPI00265EE60D|nr:hypothetical protein [Flavobacterium pectinovorum]WKL47508.1 hypothetical protein Q1W71_21435 [Flavobacterium pectinovorum]